MPERPFDADDASSAPRLPPLEPWQAPLRTSEQFDLGPRSRALEIDGELPEYRPPELASTRRATRAWMVLAATQVLWACGCGVVAILARSDAIDGEPVTERMQVMGVVGIVLLAGLAGCGAWWSYLRATNIERLDGHYPSTGRAVRVWVYPVAWVLLMHLALIGRQPHPDFDVRPIIIVGGFAIAAWRPYALIRRIFTSLVPVQPDPLIGSLAVLQIGGLGLMWWRLAVWPRSTDPVSAAEVLIGVSFAAAGALAIAVVLLRLLDRAADRSQHHRVRALQTREEHRYVRSLGLNPHNVEVYRAIVGLKQARERRRIEEERIAAERERQALAERSARGAGRRPTADGANRETEREAYERLEELAAAGGSDVVGDDSTDDRFHPRPLRQLEAARYLVLLTSVGTAVGCCWLVVRSFDLSEPVTQGRLSELDVARIDDARSATLSVLSLVMPAVALWCWMTLVWARRAGAPRTATRTCGAAFVVAAAATLVARVVDPWSRTVGSFVLLCVGAMAAVAALYTINPVADWIQRGRSALQYWRLGLVFLMVFVGIAGAFDRVGSDDSIEQLAFFGVVQGLILLVVVVVSGVTMLDVEDELRASRHLSQRRSGRRRRRG